MSRGGSELFLVIILQELYQAGDNVRVLMSRSLLTEEGTEGLESHGSGTVLAVTKYGGLLINRPVPRLGGAGRSDTLTMQLIRRLRAGEVAWV